MRTAVYCRRSILPVRVCKRTVFCRSPRSARHRIRSAGRVDLDVWSVVRVVGRRTPGQPVPSRKWPRTTGLLAKQVERNKGFPCDEALRDRSRTKLAGTHTRYHGERCAAVTSKPD